MLSLIELLLGWLASFLRSHRRLRTENVVLRHQVNILRRRAAGRPATVPADRLIYAHIDDAPDLLRDELRDDGRLLPGEGAIDLTGFLRGLRAAGYDGPVGIEVDGPALQHLAPDEAASRARRAWEAVLARAFPGEHDA